MSKFVVIFAKMDPNIDSALIKKETLSVGSKYIPLTKGTRVSDERMVEGYGIIADLYGS